MKNSNFITVVGCLTTDQSEIEKYLKIILKKKDKIYFPEEVNNIIIKQYCIKNDLDWYEIPKNSQDPELAEVLLILRISQFKNCYFLISDTAEMELDHFYKTISEYDVDKIEYKVF